MSYKYNFKAGDSVLIKHTGRKISERWLKGTDRIVALVEESEGGFTCEIEEVRWFITYDEIAGYGFTYGQEIEVSYDTVQWVKRIYIGHIESDSIWYMVKYDKGGHETFEYARPIEQVKEEYEITEDDFKAIEKFLKTSKMSFKDFYDKILKLEMKPAKEETPKEPPLTDDELKRTRKLLECIMPKWDKEENKNG